MTPKEKAERLFDKFHVEIMDFNITDLVLEDTSKQLALIAVDGIIEVLNVKQGGKIHNQMGFIDFWQEVKQEIENL